MAAATEVIVTVNGVPRSVPDGASVAELLAGMNLNPMLVVVEHNREILARSSVADVHIHAGDTLEIVHFVGGG
jgi:sulfur carrier protein